MDALKKYRNKTIAIYGMGITGCSAARAFKRLKAKVYCWDDNRKVRKKAEKLNFQLDKFWLNRSLLCLCCANAQNPGGKMSSRMLKGVPGR